MKKKQNRLIAYFAQSRGRIVAACCGSATVIVAVVLIAVAALPAAAEEHRVLYSALTSADGASRVPGEAAGNKDAAASGPADGAQVASDADSTGTDPAASTDGSQAGTEAAGQATSASTGAASQASGSGSIPAQGAGGIGSAPATSSKTSSTQGAGSAGPVYGNSPDAVAPYPGATAYVRGPDGSWVLKDQPNTTPPTPTPAEKRWVVDSAAWNEWVVDVPAQPAVAEQGHWVGYWLCGGQKFYDYADLMAYSKQLYAEGKPVPSDSSEKEWVIDVPGKDAVPEQGHWVEHAEVGHWE